MEKYISPIYANDKNQNSGTTERLSHTQYGFRAIAEKNLPVVVEINVIETIETSRGFSLPWSAEPQNKAPKLKKEGRGSGIIVKTQSDRVYIVTNQHVIGNSDDITIVLYDGREFQASLINKEEKIDLALLSIPKNDEFFPIAALGDSNSLVVGDLVMALGNPLGYESSITLGIISALNREADKDRSLSSFSNYIQTDAAINPGNSGGALVNIKGELIGINTWIASGSKGNSGVGFAIPVNQVKQYIKRFLR